MNIGNLFNASLITVVAAVQPCWAQLIDPATELRAPATSPIRHAFGVKNTGMTPEVIMHSPNASEMIRRDKKPVSNTVLDQIGKTKQSMPNAPIVP